jgi:uncharacterized protein YijF (DUF1287 family)
MLLMPHRFKLLLLGFLSFVCVACGDTSTVEVVGKPKQLIEAASWQIGKTLSYDPAYVGLEYPNGDLPIEKGVCTDVVIRAMRKAWGVDLQKLVHEDMKANFSKYPQRWGLKRPDKNIDHRRVPNLQTYFKRQGWSLAVSEEASNYEPGDIVTCTVAGRLPHIVIVSNTLNSRGVPLVIHNIGSGVVLEDCLFAYPITGHYRPK